MKNVKKIFEESKMFKEIIEGHEWTLFDSTLPDGVQPKWEELEKQGSTEEFIIGHNYIFTPIPKHGQSLRDAYSITKGLGPSILVENLNDDRWGGYRILDGSKILRKEPIFFSRIDFTEHFAGLFTPKTTYLPDSDALAIKYDKLIDTFEKYFRIVRPEEYGLETPIEMPKIPTIH